MKSNKTLAEARPINVKPGAFLAAFHPGPYYLRTFSDASKGAGRNYQVSGTELATASIGINAPLISAMAVMIWLPVSCCPMIRASYQPSSENLATITKPERRFLGPFSHTVWMNRRSC
ncbi:hypothetical protein [Acetobacterium malicum]|uniref:hypothetical protein n=1 Tax=Acetobacterium malicum TaxID=52692 RepID=UPI000479C0FE|nr:hypothetical protein [Acetobacterium dehalogenans]